MLKREGHCVKVSSPLEAMQEEKRKIICYRMFVLVGNEIRIVKVKQVEREFQPTWGDVKYVQKIWNGGGALL